MMNAVAANYHKALQHGLIGQLISDQEIKFFDSINVKDQITDNELLNLAYQSKTATRYEHNYDAFKIPDTEVIQTWQKGDIIELARQTIPGGMLGILRRIDTLVIDSTTGNSISEWNNPDSWDNVFNFALMYNNLQDMYVKDRLFVRNPSPTAYWPDDCQSNPLFPFPTWNDDRFAWGNPSNNIAITLPHNIYIRLFAICKEDTDFNHSIKGRLVSTTQTERSISAAWQARRGAHGQG